jgi:hypothetical protein
MTRGEETTMMASPNSIYHVDGPFIEAFIASDGQLNMDYHYGGTRIVPWNVSDDDALYTLARLMDGESRLKNLLINRALREEGLWGPDLLGRLPPGFLGSQVGGARAILRPKSAQAFAVLQDPTHPEFEQLLVPTFQEVGRLLNGLDGQIKLTPDFGRFARVSDLLARYTKHVLGIACSAGGCGGKASYTTTGILAGYLFFERRVASPEPITLIGADGALGRELVRHFLAHGPIDKLAVCDLSYDRGLSRPPSGLVMVPAHPGRFTDACLGRGGRIIATTVGEELENSNIDALRSETLLALAHNLAVPEGSRGLQLTRAVAARGVTAVPGQVLTLGGALTSRLEWFSRQDRPGAPFDQERKSLAHEVVRAVCGWLATKIDELTSDGMTPFEAMYEFVRWTVDSSVCPGTLHNAGNDSDPG